MHKLSLSPWHSKMGSFLALTIALNYCLAASAAAVKTEKKEKRVILTASALAALKIASPFLINLAKDKLGLGKFISDSVGSVFSLFRPVDKTIDVPGYGKMNYHVDKCSVTWGKRSEDKRWFVDVGNAWNQVSGAVSGAVNSVGNALSGLGDAFQGAVNGAVETVGNVMPGRECKVTVTDPLTGLMASHTDSSPEEGLKVALNNLMTELIKLAAQNQ